MKETTRFMFSCIARYIIKRSHEASTWRGIVMGIAGALGITLSQNEATTLIALGLALGGAIGSFLPDKLKENTNATNEKR